MEMFKLLSRPTGRPGDRPPVPIGRPFRPAASYHYKSKLSLQDEATITRSGYHYKFKLPLQVQGLNMEMFKLLARPTGGPPARSDRPPVPTARP